MFHGVLTLLTRALKSDARLRRAHAFRAGSTGMIFLFLIASHAASGGVGSPGLRFFTLISWLNLALITLAGTSFFATAITEEKEEGTLGLLQLAGVSTPGLLLGKSTARLIAALLVFVTQLPFAMLAVSLGGVTAGQIVAVYVALAAYMVMLANVALLASVAAQRSAMACAVMLLFVLLLAGVHVGDRSIDALVTQGYVTPESLPVVAAVRGLDVLERISIVTRLHEILDLDFDGSLLSRQVVLHGLLAVAAFGVSWLTFERFTRYADVSTPARGAVPKVSSRWTLFIERPWKRALLWKDYHFVTGGHTVALVKLLGYPLVLWLMYEYRQPLRQIAGMPFAQFSRQVMFVALAAEMCLYASRLFHEEMKWGTLPNLLLLPRSVASIAAGKVGGCLLGLLPALVVLCGLHVFLWREIAAFHIHVEPAGWFSQTFDLLLFLRTSVIGDLTSPGVWLILMQFLVLLHLTVFCSLLVKWGGLALAVAIQLTLSVLLAGPMAVVIAGLTASYRSAEVAVAPIIYVGIMLCVILQFLIGWQVRRAAAR